MNILCVTPWRNAWIPYWTKALEARGHKVEWFVERVIDKDNVNKLAEKVKDYDCVLCHWADKWAQVLSEHMTKPLFVICRSYEIWGANSLSDLPKIKWDNVTQLFMLNEAHYPVFECRIKGQNPIFFKNGIDLDEWTYDDKKDLNQVAYICDLGEKKGVELCVQAMHELRKLNPAVRLEHIGKMVDARRWYYAEQIFPRLNIRWYNRGYNNSHDYVRSFLKDKGWIICSSIAEGHPMNIIEAMATGTIPLIHWYPGAEHQFPREYLWANLDELKMLFNRKHNRHAIRNWAEKHLDYRKNYLPVILTMEEKCK